MSISSRFLVECNDAMSLQQRASMDASINSLRNYRFHVLRIAGMKSPAPLA